MDVELCGGPLDGHQTDVKVKSKEFDVSLFTWTVQGGVPKVLAYAFAGRTTENGRRWVLQFLYEVAKVGTRKDGESGRVGEGGEA